MKSSSVPMPRVTGGMTVWKASFRLSRSGVTSASTVPTESAGFAAAAPSSAAAPAAPPTSATSNQTTRTRTRFIALLRAPTLSSPRPDNVNTVNTGVLPPAFERSGENRRAAGELRRGGFDPLYFGSARQCELARLPRRRHRRRLAQIGAHAVARIIPPRPDIAASDAGEEGERIGTAERLGCEDADQHADADRDDLVEVDPIYRLSLGGWRRRLRLSRGADRQEDEQGQCDPDEQPADHSSLLVWQ